MSHNVIFDDLYTGFYKPQLQSRRPFVAGLGDQLIPIDKLIGGIVVTPITTSPFTWTLDSGKNIYQALNSPDIGMSFSCLISNNNNATGATMTIKFSEGLNGQLRSDVLPHNSSMTIHFVVTGVNQVTCYS